MADRTTLTQNTSLSCGIRILGQLDAGKFSSQGALSFEENAAKVVRQVARMRYKKTAYKPPSWWMPTYNGVWQAGKIEENQRFSTVVFSHRVNDQYCEALLNLIRTKRLGKVTASPAVHNPNSDNTIKTYTWDINANLKRFCVPEPRKKRNRWTRSF